MKEAGHFYPSNIALWPLCVFNAFLSVTAIPFNNFTMYAMTNTSSLPKNITTLPLSLAVSDLGVGLIVQPLFVVVLVMQLEPNIENKSAYETTYFVTLIRAIAFFCFVLRCYSQGSK